MAFTHSLVAPIIIYKLLPVWNVEVITAHWSSYMFGPFSDGCRNCPCLWEDFPYSMAKDGQWCRQERHSVHRVFHIGRFPFMYMAFIGQSFAHMPQPTHRLLVLNFKACRCLTYRAYCQRAIHQGRLFRSKFPQVFFCIFWMAASIFGSLCSVIVLHRFSSETSNSGVHTSTMRMLKEAFSCHPFSQKIRCDIWRNPPENVPKVATAYV